MGKVDLPSMRQREKERVSIICLLVWVSGKKQVQSGKHSFKERERETKEKDTGLHVSVCVTAEREQLVHLDLLTSLDAFVVPNGFSTQWTPV